MKSFRENPKVNYGDELFSGQSWSFGGIIIPNRGICGTLNTDYRLHNQMHEKYSHTLIKPYCRCLYSDKQVKPSPFY